METLGSNSLIEWGAAGQVLAGETESGDHWLVELLPGAALVAVVDGLGHGVEASRAAQIAVKTLQTHASEYLSSLVRRCHEALRSTRGAAMSLASFHGSESTMTWLGVGNVEGALLRGRSSGEGSEHTPDRESLILRSGVVGYQLPPLRTTTVRVSPGDLLILTTDGIRRGFLQQLRVDLPVQTIADQILAQYARETDDSLVLTVRYLG